jgi:transcriptional regulator with XRE-family HTH domain
VEAPATAAVQQAREALGARLREIRIRADLTAVDLASKLGRHSSKVSRIEHGRKTPSVEDIREWCRHCDAVDQAADLVASLQVIEGMYVEWRRVERTGLRRLQESYIALYERTAVFRFYEPGVIPGLFQTAEYASARMARIIAFSGLPDDLDGAVAARMERQRVLRSGRHRFAVVLEEAALKSRIGTTEMMAGQLGHLIRVGSLPNVSLGIVPSDIDRTMWSSPGFLILDDKRVLVETPSAELTITQPSELLVYIRTFSELATMAVYGAAARTLITDAIEALRK